MRGFIVPDDTPDLPGMEDGSDEGEPSFEEENEER
jgi:hypothetical protein